MTLAPKYVTNKEATILLNLVYDSSNTFYLSDSHFENDFLLVAYFQDWDIFSCQSLIMIELKMLPMFEYISALSDNFGLKSFFLEIDVFSIQYDVVKWIFDFPLKVNKYTSFIYGPQCLNSFQ